MTLLVLERAQPEGPIDSISDYTRDLVASVGGLWPDDTNKSGLEAENQKLQNQLAEAEGKLATTAEIERDRNQLAEILNVRMPVDSPKVAARVKAIGVSNYDATIDIDKGTNDGIATGMPVIDGRGLVGRIVETSGNSSKVLLTSDSTSNVGVRIGSSGEIGVATGVGSGKKLRVDMIDLDSNIKPGDIAVTSGLSGSLFPAEIPVGTIESVDAGPRDLRKTVTLKPLASMGTLDTVAVLQWRHQ